MLASKLLAAATRRAAGAAAVRKASVLSLSQFANAQALAEGKAPHKVANCLAGSWDAGNASEDIVDPLKSGSTMMTVPLVTSVRRRGAAVAAAAERGGLLLSPRWLALGADHQGDAHRAGGPLNPVPPAPD
jgi:hypothetical protein